ncbi:signal recognition particle-docking protein FtsY [Lactobacillus rodentium]|uniref:Signal recognition particle receptor FtsY n=1 Tax=Lactobacillus rodentium TaxID=947835 RepID=A0A2Z6T9C6_9LACO|nr:signal recognition particle-docking protein FtsY [Lactobacillus rodentium]MCR1894066.1 signal recognition particle-docking protein FtsY [Lactobacillus rodentium]GBG04363.1 cell division protein FtsY [Lactobacillus rodentium]
MGLFDRIKKSLFNKKDEQEVEDEKNTSQSEEEEQASETEEKVATPEDKQEASSSDLKQEDQQAEINSQAPENEKTSVVTEQEKQESSNASQNKEETSTQSNEVEVTDETVIESESVPEESSSDDETETDSEDTKVETTEETEEADQEKYDKGLEKTNRTFGERLNAFFAKFRSVDEDFFDDLEDLLIESDVGYETAMQLTDSLRDEAKLQKAKSHDELKQVVVEKLVEIYDQGENNKDSALTYDPDAKPNVYLFVGVNGAGKTTTIGKLAKRLKDSGKSVMMVAGDTFRAGAVEQLVEWGKRDGVEVITGKENADPASVVYDGVSKAKEQGIDYLLVDTAGRLQNKVNLMNELDKIERTIKKILPDQPNEVLLVLDGSTGQNALLQAKDFNKTTELTGLVLTKLDGSSKGGVVIAIRNEMNLPVKLVGLGEKVDDLADFDAEKFAIGLFQGLI